MTDYRHADGTPCTHGRITRDGLTLDTLPCPGLAWRIHRKNDARAPVHKQGIFSFSHITALYGKPGFASGGTVHPRQNGKSITKVYEDSVPVMVGFGEALVSAKQLTEAMKTSMNQIRAMYGLSDDVNKALTDIKAIADVAFPDDPAEE